MDCSEQMSADERSSRLKGPGPPNLNTSTNPPTIRPDKPLGGRSHSGIQDATIGLDSILTLHVLYLHR